MSRDLVPSGNSDLLRPEFGGALGPAGSAPLPADPEEQDDVDWGRYLYALRRYKWLILIVTFLGTAGGVLATRLIDPEYSANATIWVQSPPGPTGPMRSEGLLEQQAWVELLTSFAVLDSVVQKERMYLKLDSRSDSVAFRDFGIRDRFLPGEYRFAVAGTGKSYTLTREDGFGVETGPLGDAVGAKVGFAWRPDTAQLRPGQTIAFQVMTPRDAARELRENLTTVMPEEGNFISVELRGSDPVVVTRALNRLLDEFVGVAADLKRYKLAETSKVLREQLDQVGDQLRTAEQSLESYRTRIITLPSENAAPIAPGLSQTQPQVLTEYFENKLRAETLRREREALEALAARGDQLLPEQLLAIGAVANSPDIRASIEELTRAEGELRTLRQRYTDEAKQVQDVQARIASLRSRVLPQQTRQLAQALRGQEQALAGVVASRSRELQEIPSRTITEQRLERERSTLATLYTDLQQRFQTARLEEASAIPDVKILDRAVQPEKPTTDQAPRIIAMALLASLALSIGLAVLLDRFDKRVRYPNQVTKELGLPILGAIPAIRRVKQKEQDPEEASQVIEAFRAVRLNLAHVYGQDSSVLLTITSPGAGDGKSLVSSNLALSFAEAGYRTLLIDGDIRRGELHRVFDVDRRPGLLDFLAGNAKLDDVVRPTSHPLLSVIPCGVRLHHGPELLGSRTMQDTMQTLRQRFGAIIIDSPPLAAGIDPFVLGAATGNLVLVLRSGETDRQMAEAKLKLVDRLPIRLLGAVLNDVQTEGVYKYYSYIYGYALDEDAPKLSSRGSDAPTESAAT